MYSDTIDMQQFNNKAKSVNSGAYSPELKGNQVRNLNDPVTVMGSSGISCHWDVESTIDPEKAYWDEELKSGNLPI